MRNIMNLIVEMLKKHETKRMRQHKDKKKHSSADRETKNKKYAKNKYL